MKYFILLLLSTILCAADPQIGLGPAPASTSVFPGGLPTANEMLYSNGSGIAGDPGFTYVGQGQYALAVGTVTSATTELSLSATWNNNSATFYGQRFIITNTASQGPSRIWQIFLNGSEQDYFDQNGSFVDYSNAYVSGTVTAANTAVSTSPTVGALLVSGGVGVTKNVTCGYGLFPGVTVTATAAGTTTITNTSTQTQIFTGSTTQTVQLPAAALFGAGIDVVLHVVNRSTGAVSLQRAGSDDINGATSNVTVPTLTSTYLDSDGVSNWYTK